MHRWDEFSFVPKQAQSCEMFLFVLAVVRFCDFGKHLVCDVSRDGRKQRVLIGF